MLSFTGGVGGACVLLVIPATLVLNARKLDMEEKAGMENQNKSQFGAAWIIVVLTWALVTICTTIYLLADQIIEGKGPGGE